MNIKNKPLAAWATVNILYIFYNSFSSDENSNVFWLYVFFALISSFWLIRYSWNNKRIGASILKTIAVLAATVFVFILGFAIGFSRFWQF